MDWTTLIIQLGISGLVVFAGYKIAMVLIDKWAQGDQARTKTIGDGFKAINEQHQEVVRTLNEHQIDELNRISHINVSIATLNSRIETVFDLTPIKGIMKADLPSSSPIPHAPKVIVSGELDDENTPVDNPTKRQTGPVKIPEKYPRPASQPGPVTEYGPFTTRPKKA